MLASDLPTQVPSADLALVNGQVFTPLGWARSVAIARQAIIGGEIIHQQEEWR